MSTSKHRTFDVRPILARGEEPLPLILEQVRKLGTGETVTVIAPFMPAPLIELLQSEGYASTIERQRDGGWAVNFTHT
jgi:uncharacterized protein (DUF2249 family)